MRVVRIKSAVSSAYLVIDDKVILIDSGHADQADRILAAAEKAGVDPQDISLLILTHGHGDHAGSSAELKRRLGLPVAVHAADADRLRRGENGPVRPRTLEGRLIAATVVGPYEPVEPDVVLSEEISLKRYGVDAQVLFTPGHTPGSLSVVLPEHGAIIGDLMMGGVLGGTFFGRRPRLHYFLEDESVVPASVAKVLQHAPSTLYIGHGGPLRPDAVARAVGLAGK